MSKNIESEQSQPESEALPTYQYKHDISLEPAEFVLNAGHYEGMKEVAASWVAAGFAREVLVAGKLYLIIDTTSLVQWIEINISPSSFEKFQSYVLVILSVLASYASSEREPNGKWSAILQKVLLIFSATDFQTRADRVGTTIYTLEQELRQVPVSAVLLLSPKDKILFSVQANISHVLDEGLAAFKAEKIDTGMLAAEVARLDDEFSAEFLIYHKKLQDYLHHLHLANKITKDLLEKIDEYTWENHPQVLEYRQGLAESIEWLAKFIPDTGQIGNFYLEVKNALMRWQAVIAWVAQAEAVDEVEVSNTLLEIEKQLKNLQLK